MLLKSSGRVLDPIERAMEVLFGVIMVLTFTGSISVAQHGAAEVRTVLVAAVAGNVAWGVVDAAMYLLASFTEHARARATLQAVRKSARPESAHRLILDALPAPIADVLTPGDVEAVRVRLVGRPAPSAPVTLTRTDLRGAAGVFLLVFLSTLPLVVPFLVIREPGPALRTSNAVALAMLFVTGWSLGRYAGRSGWRAGLGMVAVGVVLVGVTIALGG